MFSELEQTSRSADDINDLKFCTSKHAYSELGHNPSLHCITSVLVQKGDGAVASPHPSGKSAVSHPSGVALVPSLSPGGAAVSPSLTTCSLEIHPSIV